MKNTGSTKRKVTMRDVANEVGVSLATVSYVLNHSEKEKISHETRLAVLETAKRMNYIPNLSARSLSAKKSNLIGIIVNMGEDSSYGKKVQYYDLVAQLQKQFKQMSYDTIVTFSNDIEDVDIISKRSLEATFVIDIEEQYLKKITSNYYVPVIFLDCDFEENLFFKILPDYQAMFNEAKKMFYTEDVFLVCEDIMNARVKQIFENNFKKEDIFINNPESNLQEFLEAHKQMKGIVIGDILGLMVGRILPPNQYIVITHSIDDNILSKDVVKFEVSNEYRAKKAVHVLKKLFALEYEIHRKNRILLPFHVVK